MEKEQTVRPYDWREGRRVRAWELAQQGWKQKDIAAALGVSGSAVSQWLSRAVEGGVEALRRTAARATRTISSVWQRIVRDSKQGPLRLHDLRHSAGSILLAEGVPITVVAAILGDEPATVFSY